MKRLIDRIVIFVWGLIAKPGDPPRLVQRSFDRENLRLLREALP